MTDKNKAMTKAGLGSSLFFKKGNVKLEDALKEIKTQNQKEESRVEAIVAKAGNSNVGELVKKFKPVLDVCSSVFDAVAPPVIKISNLVYSTYTLLPIDLCFAILGLILTFFGGSFAVTIAACEAFYNSGYETVMTNGEYLWAEFKILWKKSREDDEKDEDKDGVADVLQISAKELVTRKIGFFFANCSDPQKLMDMFWGIANCLMAVIAVLKVQFAKVIALGAAIGENLRKPASWFFVPILSTVLPSKYHQWIAPGINFVCKAVAITIAWMIQRVISAVESAIRGGLLFSRRILKCLNKRGIIDFDDEETYLDEILGWGLAAVGIYFQIMNLFAIPFPLNLLLFPVSIFENTLIWIISE